MRCGLPLYGYCGRRPTREPTLSNRFTPLPPSRGGRQRKKYIFLFLSFIFNLICRLLSVCVIFIMRSMSFARAT